MDCHNSQVYDVTRYIVELKVRENPSVLNTKSRAYKEPQPSEKVATTAVYRLIATLDTQMLRYLDVNRSYLEQMFMSANGILDPNTLNTVDYDAYTQTHNPLLRLIKTLTVHHYNGKKLNFQIHTAEALVIAKMEKNQADNAQQALSKAISKATPSLPKSVPTLRTAIKIVQAEEAKKNKGKQQRKKPTRKVLQLVTPLLLYPHQKELKTTQKTGPLQASQQLRAQVL